MHRYWLFTLDATPAGRQFAAVSYWAAYVIGILLGALLARRLAKEGLVELTMRQIAAVFSVAAFGLLIGARLGYVIVYNPSFFASHPSEIVAFWHGGMSFHGGLIGAVMAFYLFCKSTKRSLVRLLDLGATCAPIGILLGRIGNFLYGELVGRVTDVPWAVIFPSRGWEPRHPSPIYEALVEGVLLFAILWIGRARLVRAPGRQSAVFLVFYGVGRFVLEFFRQPDPQLGFVFIGLTMGQLLCLLMIPAGLAILWRTRPLTSNPAHGSTA